MFSHCVNSIYWSLGGPPCSRCKRASCRCKLDSICYNSTVMFQCRAHYPYDKVIFHIFRHKWPNMPLFMHGVAIKIKLPDTGLQVTLINNSASMHIHLTWPHRGFSGWKHEKHVTEKWADICTVEMNAGRTAKNPASLCWPGSELLSELVWASFAASFVCKRERNDPFGGVLMMHGVFFCPYCHSS